MEADVAHWLSKCLTNTKRYYWLDRGTERQLVLVDEPKNVLSLIENKQTD